MAGNMGNESVTVKNLKVLQVDEQNGLVVVNGKKCFQSVVTITHIQQAAYRAPRTKLFACQMLLESPGQRAR